MSKAKTIEMEKKWFEGSNLIESNIQELKRSIENHGKFYVGVVGFMSGLTSVELLEQGRDYVIIKTNEGIMKRTNISKQIEPNSVVIEFDEEYEAGRMVTARSHYFDEFLKTENGISHRTVISEVKAPGLLGFFYRTFGSGSIGKAVLDSYKAYLERSGTW